MYAFLEWMIKNPPGSYLHENPAVSVCISSFLTLHSYNIIGHPGNVIKHFY